MIKVITCTLLVTLFLACDSRDVPAVPDTGIVGAWRWTGTYGGLTGQLAVTPETTGTEVLLELGDDARYTVISNGVERQAGTYALTFEESIYDGAEARYITFSPRGSDEVSISRSGVYALFDGIIRVNENNELSISDNHYDGVGSIFVRR